MAIYELDAIFVEKKKTGRNWLLRSFGWICIEFHNRNLLGNGTGADKALNMFIPNPQPGFLPDSLKGGFVTPEQLCCMDCLRVNISKLIHPQTALKVGFGEHRAWGQLCQMASQGMCHVITWQLPHLPPITRGQVFAIAMSSPDITTLNFCLAAYSPHLLLSLDSVLLQGLTLWFYVRSSFALLYLLEVALFLAFSQPSIMHLLAL